MAKTKKQMIFDTAAELFREKGYPAASMRELAERVGLIQASSLYNHLRSKEEVLRKICFEHAEQFIAGITSIETAPTAPTEKLRALIRLHIRIATENPTSVTVFNNEWRHLSAPHLDDFLAKRKTYEQIFKAIIEQGIRSGAFKAVDPNVALYTILTSMRWVHYWYKPSRNVTVEQLEEDMFVLLIQGLEA